MRRLLLLLVWIFSLHLGGVYVFMSGFLLSRSALLDVSLCAESVSLFFQHHFSWRDNVVANFMEEPSLWSDAAEDPACTHLRQLQTCMQVWGSFRACFILCF